MVSLLNDDDENDECNNDNDDQFDEIAMMFMITILQKS